MKGCKSATASSAFMKTGMPSKNLSIPSVMDLATAVCSIAPAAAVMRGWNGVKSFCAVSTALPKGKGNVFHRNEAYATQDAPSASSLRFELGPDGPSLTMFHVSVSLSGAGPEPKGISRRGSMNRLVRKTPGPTEGGIGRGFSCAPVEDVGVSAVDSMGGVDVRLGIDGLRRSSADDAFFFPHRREIVSVPFCCGRDSSL